MPGAPNVCRNIVIWEQLSVRKAAGLMDAHIQRSVVFAKTHRRWHDKSSQAREGLHAKTFVGQGTQIVSTIAHGVEHGVYLELRSAFGGDYKILEQARDNNLSVLINQLQALFAGYGVTFRGLAGRFGYQTPSYYSGE